MDELLSGYDRLPEFQEQMRLMDVEREDMQLGITRSTRWPQNFLKQYGQCACSVDLVG